MKKYLIVLLILFTRISFSQSLGSESGLKVKGLNLGQSALSVKKVTATGTAGIGGIDSYTKLMLHMDGANGSTTFTDEIGKTVTANGDAQISTAQYASLTGNTASGLFDGTGDYLTVPDNDDWAFGTGDWTIDFWAARTATNAIGRMMGVVDADALHWNFTIGYEEANNTIRARTETAGGTQQVVLGTGATDTNFHHYALVRNSTTISLYFDGVSLGTPIDISTNALRDGNTPMTIGRWGDYTNENFNGNFDELRVSKGIARWTTNFTPPTSPYTE